MPLGQRSDLKNDYEEGLLAFYQQDFQTALDLFSQISRNYEDAAATFMVFQAQRCLESPPSEQWKGEIILLEK
ncbi:MAG: hypothetical protein HQM11_11115 [SAR324 cluster bacterium]|nr:hypothetical protein [SAR324 cluster bacterium]